MNKKVLLAEIVIAFLIMAAFRFKPFNPTTVKHSSRQEVYKNKPILHCSPDWSIINADSLAK
ncbi:MAG: hypothetical protein ABJA78_17865, partial [Ferruginibacter sp.]